MMTRLAVATALALGALGFAWQPEASAHAGHSHGSVNIAVPETADGILLEMQKHHAAISAAVNGKKLSAVHEHAEAMTALAKALPAKVAEGKKALIDRTTANMAQSLDTLHHAADDGDQPGSGIELKKLDGIVTTLEKQMKSE